MASVAQPETPSADGAALFLAGRMVPIEFPAQTGPYVDADPWAEVDNWRIALSDDEEAMATRYRLDGGWQEISKAYQNFELSPDAVPYRIKTLVFSKSGLLDFRPDGTVVSRRGSIESFQVDKVLSALAATEAMIEIAAEGRLDVIQEVTLDDDLVMEVVTGPTTEASAPYANLEPELYYTLRKAETTPSLPRYGLPFVLSSVAPLINSELFETDDQVYRGPFDSVFVMTGALTNVGHRYAAEGVPISVLSYYTSFNDRPEEGLPSVFYREYLSHLAFHLERDGEAWAAGIEPNVATPPALFDTQWLVQAFLDREWQMDETDLLNLPVLSPDEAANELGLSETPTKAPAFEVLKGGEESLVAAVAPNILDLFLDRAYGAEPVAILGGENPRFIFEAARSPQLTALSSRVGSGPVAPFRDSDLTLEPVTRGSFVALEPEENEAEPFFRFAENLPGRYGYISLWRGQGQVIEPSLTPRLSFEYRLRSPDPIGLELLSATGDSLAFYTLAGQVQVPSELGDPELPRIVPYQQAEEETWHEVVADLTELEAPVAEIRLAPVPYGQYFQRGSIRTEQYDLKNFRVSPDALLKVTEPSEPQDPYAQDLAALTALDEPLTEPEIALLQEGLDDSRRTVRLTALDVAARLNPEQPIEALLANARSANPETAYMGSRALARIDDPAAEAAWKSMVEGGPFNHNRRFAAEFMVERPFPNMAASLNGLMASTSWRTRAAGVKAVGAIDTRAASLIEITMLQEIDPRIRLLVAQNADVNLDLVARRLLFTAVNDPSEWVRLASYRALLASAIDQYRTEALRGVRAPTYFVKSRLLESMIDEPREEHREALRLAVVDPDPRVRALALKGFSAQPGEVSVEEVANTLTDENEEVLAALLELAMNKNLTLPPEIIERLTESESPNISDAAKQLEAVQP
jgi:hypothetical protein